VSLTFSPTPQKKRKKRKEKKKKKSRGCSELKVAENMNWFLQGRNIAQGTAYS
jgi:hypothetical protein